jgi:hypothetical protein
MGAFAAPFGSRNVAETYIAKEIKDIAENCSAEIGLPAKVAVTVTRRDPANPHDKTVVVTLNATWA